MPRGESVRKAIEELKYAKKPPIRKEWYQGEIEKKIFIRSEIEYYKKVNDKVRLDLLSKMV
jgi:hypothetical protein